MASELDYRPIAEKTRDDALLESLIAQIDAELSRWGFAGNAEGWADVIITQGQRDAIERAIAVCKAAAAYADSVNALLSAMQTGAVFDPSGSEAELKDLLAAVSHLKRFKSERDR